MQGSGLAEAYLVPKTRARSRPRVRAPPFAFCPRIACFRVIAKSALPTTCDSRTELMFLPPLMAFKVTFLGS